MNTTDERFFKIRVSTLLPGQPTTFDVFIMINGRQVHYLRAGEALKAEKIAHLDRADVFFVPEPQRPLYKRYVFDRMNQDSLDVAQKAMILRESSLTLAEEIFEQPDVEQALTDSKELISNFIAFMEQEPAGMAHLISLSSHDFYTYNHSLDVGIYSLGLGQILGYSAEDLQELGRGALFHDIGKRNVHVDIICKQGTLDDVEWAQMQKHPQYGLKILTDYGCSEAMKACCFEHHESFLGNGYPQQLTGPEIHNMARIVAITDTYDALTTKRSYNQPMSPKDAVEFMMTKLKAKYDPDILKALNSVLFKMEKAS
ncbi:MAG TPA: HD domain-containing phosphohydrolase [Bdellovibrionales bacterium]|nr:HD domain-containing phosphohydrolase [Bdellovibrionales bacterium]